MLLEPLANRLVIDLQQAPGEDDREEEYSNTHHDVLPQRCACILRNPVHLHVHQRIVCDIDRVGNISQPFAHGRAPGVGGLGACTGKDYQREQNQDADCLEQAVRDTLLSTYAWEG